MSDTPMDTAKRQLAAAQAKVDALSRVPAVDDFPAGTVLKWRATDQVQQYAAFKGNGEIWWVTGRERGITWLQLISLYLTHPLEYLLVATGWTDASVQPPEPEPPALKLGGGGKGSWILRDTRNGVSWERHGNTWERL